MGKSLFMAYSDNGKPERMFLYLSQFLDFVATFWTKIGGFSLICPKNGRLSIQLRAKEWKKFGNR